MRMTTGGNVRALDLLPSFHCSPPSGFGRTGGASRLVGENAPPRIAVYFDWQNAYKTAREAFGLSSLPSEHGNFSPYRLARLLAAGNGRGKNGGELVRVEIHRGLPSQRHDPIGYAANRRQAAAWEGERRGIVIPRPRPLRYPRNYPAEPAVEKGVDVQLAVSAIEASLTKRCDVAIIVSHDTDLLPVPEAIVRLLGGHRVETASWSSPTFHSRLRPKPAVYHHLISERVFKKIETPVNYAHAQR